MYIAEFIARSLNNMYPSESRAHRLRLADVRVANRVGSALSSDLRKRKYLARQPSEPRVLALLRIFRLIGALLRGVRFHILLCVRSMFCCVLGSICFAILRRVRLVILFLVCFRTRVRTCFLRLGHILFVLIVLVRLSFFCFLRLWLILFAGIGISVVLLIMVRFLLLRCLLIVEVVNALLHIVVVLRDDGKIL